MDSDHKRLGLAIRIGSFKISESAACDTYRVLIAFSDGGITGENASNATGAGDSNQPDISPTNLRNQLLFEPGISAVDLFDAQTATPTLAQLSTYDVVVAYSNNAYDEMYAMGNVLADYADTGGAVVGINFNWFAGPFALAGRWMTGGYTPFNAAAPNLFTDNTLGTFSALHPLMQGITALNGHFRHDVTLAPGATQVAAWADAVPMIAVKTQAGQTGVGINNYIGESPNDWSGQFGRVVANAARWLRPARTINGAITLADPTQTSRLNRNSPASHCGAPEACSTIAGTFHYDAHTFVNTTGAPACITMTLDSNCGVNQVFAGAYLNSFNPAAICTNNIGDLGASPVGAPTTGAFSVPAGATFIIVVSEVGEDVGCSDYTLTVSGLCRTAPVPTSVVSRKLHGATPFDIIMPLIGPSGVECRRGTGAGQNNHQLRVTFASPPTVGGVSVASTDGLATATHSIAGNVVTVDLAAVTDTQVLSVALINTSSGGNVGTITIPMGILLGDTNGDRAVNSGDTIQTRGRAGQLTNATNFRSDVNETGDINAGDTTLVRSRAGNALP